MTRILRLLLIAAVLLPLSNYTAAQELKSDKQISNLELKDATTISMGKVVEATATSAPRQHARAHSVSPKAETTTVVVANGTTTNNYLPVYGYYFEQTGSNYRYQMIYPATMLTGLSGYKIKSITFHTSTGIKFGNPNGYYGTGNLKLTVGTINTTSFSSNNFTSSYTSIANKTITPVYNAQDMTFTFDEPFEYPDGTNLIFETQVTEAGQYDSSNGATKFYGENQSNNCSYGYGGNRQQFLPKVTFEVEKIADTEAIEFGNVEVNSSKTLSARITNPSDEAVTATLTTAAPFSVASSEVTLPAGTSNINVTFSPTAPMPYSGTLVVNMNGTEIVIPLKGTGNVTGSPVALRDSTFFKGITYEWTNDEGNHISRLDETATDPDQIIAMLTEVYTNPTIPGNFKRGFDANGNYNETYKEVSYPGMGTITHSGSSYDNVSYYDFDPTYGWNIPGEVVYGGYDSSYRTYYSHLKQNQYQPDNEGVTLLLVELPDEYNKTEFTNTLNDTTFATNYDRLRFYIQSTMKSARIISQAKRTGTGQEAGTLFKIDCEKMNKFYLLAKGQVRLIYNSMYALNTTSATFCPYPIYAYSTRYTIYNHTNNFVDNNTYAPLYHMFEQFSPQSSDNDADATYDYYQDMINMTSFPVMHDCSGVATVGTYGHQFMMYGADSEAYDCQDVHDMMFFVPDYRMLKDDTRDNDNNAGQFYLNYNQNHQPKIGLYVIRQDEITCTDENKHEEYYMLQLNWRTNLDDYLPSDEQEFELLQLVYNEETGTTSYVPVYYMNEQGKYTDADGNEVTTPVPIMLQMEAGQIKDYPSVYVKRQKSSQQVTYAIRGRDVGHFLDLQISNQQSYIIPGLDPNEMIKLTDATHYSRFNPQSVKNCYSNKIVMENNAIGINNNAIVDGENGTKLFIKRTHTENVNNVATPISETIATITFNNHASSSRTLTVTMANQDPKSEYPNGETSGQGAGYHANKGETSWSQSYNVVTTGDNVGNIILNPSLIIYDNFVVDVSENKHPASYSYRVETNYSGAIHLDATGSADDSNFTQGNEVWYAWTWSTADDGIWVKGINTTTRGKFLFTPVKEKIKFVRMNPNGAPSWDSNVAWNQTGDETVTGDTYTLKGWTYGEWSGSNDATAYSNDFRIKVYKTDSKMNSTYDIDQVTADLEKGYMELDANVEFKAKVEYNSMTEILRYDAYRWGETDDRYIIDKVGNNDEEEDIGPTGIAANHGNGYSVSMNKIGTSDYYTSSVDVSENDNDKWASFLDYVPVNEVDTLTVGMAYTYAPVAEAFTFGKDVNNAARTDYNTYGGPLKNVAVGKIGVSVVEPTKDDPQMSDYVWEKDGKKYTYYRLKLNIDTLNVPAGYDIYKICAWREIDEEYLGEELEVCQNRIKYPYRFEHMTYPNFDKKMMSFVLGGTEEDIEMPSHQDGKIENYRGTFGARKVITEEGETGVIQELPVCLYVRIYFTRKSNLPQTTGDIQGAPRLQDEEQEPNLPADGKYYIAEQIIDYTIEGKDDGSIPTGFNNINTVREVAGVKYYNVAGIESDTPFQGVNIVVTRYTDGTMTTRKVVK